METTSNEFRSVFKGVIVGVGRSVKDLRIVEIRVNEEFVIEVFIEGDNTIVSLRCVPNQEY